MRAVPPAAVAALRLLALTGLRREEACGLRWREIDTARRMPAPGDDEDRPLQVRPIGQPARRLDRSRFLQGASEWVFPNREGTGSADIKKRIAGLFEAAGLAGARAHDLRRTFASVAADEGYGDATIGELLGHARRGVTARHYIRRLDAALIAAADQVAERIATAMDGNKGGDVLPFKKGAKNVR